MPFVSIVLGSYLSRWPPAHVFHFVAALAYAAAPVGLLLLARAISGSLIRGIGAALLWSLLSPSVLFPQILRDIGTPWANRRLQNIVQYGETRTTWRCACCPFLCCWRRRAWIVQLPGGLLDGYHHRGPYGLQRIRHRCSRDLACHASGKSRETRRRGTLLRRRAAEEFRTSATIES